MKIVGIRIILIGFSIRLLIAVWNGFFGPSFGADLDAYSFHLEAVEFAAKPFLAQFRIGWIYSNFLGLVYYATTDSLFIGSLLSCVVWLGSALILGRCLCILYIERKVQYKVMMVYSLLPSSIMFTAVTLREPYQILFVNIAIYAVLKIHLHKTNRHWITLMLAISGASSLHGGLFAFGIILFSGALLLVSMRGKKGVPWAKLSLMGATVAFFSWYVFSFFGSISYSLDEGLGSAIQVYQEGLLTVDARTNYKTVFEFEGFGDLLKLLTIGFFQYLFEPFPWNISSISDIVALLENMLRGWLIWKALMAVRNAPIQQQKVLLFIFISYLTMEMIWSFGTINWGTAIRHHLPALSLLLLAAHAASYRTAGVKKSKLSLQN